MTDRDDQAILDQIHELMGAEHELLEHHPDPGRDPEVERQLAALEVEIDQLWDLLRQRRALRRAGSDPATATVRSPGTVEGYQQ
jgi:hypothetical protein